MKKICGECGIEKDINEFHIRSDAGPNGRKSSCKICRNKKRSEYAKENRENENNRIREWRRNNPEKKLMADREWRRKNPDKVKVADKQWKLNNKDAVASQKAKRRALSVGVNEDFDANKRKLTFDKFGNMCFNCRTEEGLTIDHHMPLSSGYALKESNAVALCRSCNSSKGVKLPEEFYTTDQLIELNKLLSNRSDNERT